MTISLCVLIATRKKQKQFVLPPGVIHPLDFKQKIFMNLHDQGVWTIVTTSIIRTNKQVTISHVTKMAWHLMEKYALLRSLICKPQKGSKHAYLYEVHLRDLIDSVVTEAQNTNWKLIMENKLLTQFNSVTGPLWSLSLVPQVDYETATISCGDLHVKSMSKSNVGGIETFRCPGYTKTGGSYTSALIFRFHHSIVDGISRTRIVGDALKMLDRVLSGNALPKERAELFGPITQHLSSPTWKELILLQLNGWFEYFDLFRVKTTSIPNNFLERMGAETFRKISPMKRTRIIPLEWSTESTTRLLTACKRHDCTVQGTVQTAVGIAMVKIMSKGQREFQQTLNMLVSVNLRPLIKNVPLDAVGVYVDTISMKDTYAVDTEAGVFWEQAKETSNDIKQKIKNGEPFLLSRLDFGPKHMADMYCKRMEMMRNDFDCAGRNGFDVSFSNVGNCPHLPPKTNMIFHLANFTAIAEHNLGANFVVFVTTFHDRLFWTFNYQNHIVSAEMAQDFVKLLNKTLIQFVSE